MHTPLLPTNLFNTLRSTLPHTHSPALQPFNLFKFLFLKGEFETLIEIYESFYSSPEEAQPTEVLAGGEQRSNKRNRKTQKEERSAELRIKSEGLIDSESAAENDYWVGFAYSAMGKSEEAIALLERSLNGGYIPAATLLASYAHDAKERERVRAYLNLLKPFDDLEPWHQAIAYREKGKLLEDAGQFAEAKEAYKISWDVLTKLPNAQILIGFAGQLFSWTLELFSQSYDALEVIREARKFASANRRIQLTYHQVLAAGHINSFEEARSVLEEFEMFVPNNPHLQGLAFQANGVLERLEGHWMIAIEHFENAVVAASGSHSDIPLAANLYASHCSLMLGDKAGAIAYLERAESEFFAIDPFLAPAYSLRAQAGISMRRGAVDVALKRPTALDHLENARQIFAELGLPLGQCQALLHLASWYAAENNIDRAVELVHESEELRKQFQDIASYEAELATLPNLKPIFEIATRDERGIIPD